jgi:hypothetical protein
MSSKLLKWADRILSDEELEKLWSLDELEVKPRLLL